MQSTKQLKSMRAYIGRLSAQVQERGSKPAPPPVDLDDALDGLALLDTAAEVVKHDRSGEDTGRFTAVPSTPTLMDEVALVSEGDGDGAAAAAAASAPSIEYAPVSDGAASPLPSPQV
jgi:hypothetical protein